MKKVLFFSLTVLLVAGILVSACSRKRTVTMADGDAVATTVPGSATSTFTFTNTYTPVNTATITNTVNPLFTSTNTGTATQIYTSTATPTPQPAYAHSGQPGWIDDCEDIYGPNQNDFNTSGPGLNKGGYWITYDDRANTGTSYVWPMSAPWAEVHGLPHGPLDVPFQMSPPGYTGSPYGTAFAARMTGYVTTNTVGPLGLPAPDDHTGYQYGFIGMGTQLTPTAGEPNCQEVDISAMGFTGIRFWVKGDGMGYSVKLPYTMGASTGFTRCDSTQYNPSLDGNNDIKITFTANATWGMFQVPFTALTQEAGWGTTLIDKSVVLKHLKQIQWQTLDQLANRIYPHVTDLWIDDVQFY